jgi:hypothetical protein
MVILANWPFGVTGLPEILPELPIFNVNDRLQRFR